MPKPSYNELLDIVLRLGEVVYPLNQESHGYGEVQRFHGSWGEIQELGEKINLRVARNLQGALMDTGEPTSRFQRQYFAGNGSQSIYEARRLHNRLDYGLSELSGMQQGAEDVSMDGIRDVVRDVAMALTGEAISFHSDAPEVQMTDPVRRKDMNVYKVQARSQYIDLPTFLCTGTKGAEQYLRLNNPFADEAELQSWLKVISEALETGHGSLRTDNDRITVFVDIEPVWEG